MSVPLRADKPAKTLSDIAFVGGDVAQLQGDLYLPEGVDTESAAATFRDGVLQIEMVAPRRLSPGRALQIGDRDASATTSHPASGNESQAQGGGPQQQR